MPVNKLGGETLTEERTLENYLKAGRDRDQQTCRGRAFQTEE